MGFFDLCCVQVQLVRILFVSTILLLFLEIEQVFSLCWGKYLYLQQLLLRLLRSHWVYRGYLALSRLSTSSVLFAASFDFTVLAVLKVVWLWLIADSSLIFVLLSL